MTQHFSVRFDETPSVLLDVPTTPLAPVDVDLPIAGLYMGTSILNAPADLPAEGDGQTIETPDGIWHGRIRSYDPETRILRVTLI